MVDAVPIEISFAPDYRSDVTELTREQVIESVRAAWGSWTQYFDEDDVREEATFDLRIASDPELTQHGSDTNPRFVGDRDGRVTVIHNEILTGRDANGSEPDAVIQLGVDAAEVASSPEHRAAHEIGHALVFQPPMANTPFIENVGRVDGDSVFLGENAIATYGEPVPVEPDAAHVAASRERPINSVMGGVARSPSALDASMLADMGFPIEGSNSPNAPREPQAKVFLTSGNGVSLADAARVFGQSRGDEQVFLSSGVAGVELDANVERIDIATNFDALAFQVNSDGLAITNDGTTIASLPSLNQDVSLRFNDGNATLSQTGAQTFALSGGTVGSTRIDADGADLGSVTLGNATASPPSAEPEAPAANVFLNSEATFTVAESARVFGRSGGNETVVVADGTSGVETDANLERLDIPQRLNELEFQVTNAGLEIREDGKTLASMASLNQDVELRVANGDATISQAGAQSFEIRGGSNASETIEPNIGGQVDLSLGEDTAENVTLIGIASTETTSEIG